VLVVGLTRGDPGTLDPTLTPAFSAVVILRSICERLYDFDARSQVVPELATALPQISKDKRTYTIPLRHGIRFNDGTPFDAQAVEASLERDLTLPGSRRASDLSAIDTVTPAGPYTVVIHLKMPFAPLLANLATNVGIVMSPTQLAKLGGNFGTDPVGVGPFMFDHRNPGDSVTVIKSPYYYDQAAVHLDKIVYQDEPNAAAAAAALQAGDIQMLDSVDPSQLPALDHDSNVRLIKQTQLGWSGIQINIGDKNGVGNLPYAKSVGTPLSSSPLLRQAFEEAIDREALVKVVLAGEGVPDCTPIGPTSPDHDPTIHCTPYDPQDAKKLVAKSGTPNPTVHLLVAADEVQTVQLAQFVQAEEAAVGIDVVIDSLDHTAVQAREQSGAFDAVIQGWTGSPATDRSIYQFVATDGSADLTGYSNPRVDLILANARKVKSGSKALRTLYHAALQIILADRPIIYLDHAFVFAAVASNVKGVEFLSDIQARVNLVQYR